MVTDQATHEAIEYVLTRGVVQVEKKAELRHLLNTGKPVRIKLGVDPSHYDLTIGHAVVFRKLRQFQRLGHKAVVVIGDWTARLGDPSEREDARKLQSHKTVAQMLARDDFSKRYKSGVEIYLSEFMYPLLQGYDSVALHADVEIGGTDQTFNLLVGRELQPDFGQPSQQVLTVQLIVGLDGVKKMGKSLSNYIAMTAPASDMYGKLMSLPDHAMMSYFETLTDVPQAE